MNRGLLSAMAEIAAPVIEHYHDDFRVHDAKVILTLAPGDVILWTPRKCGSHLIVLARDGVPNESAAEHFAAVTDLATWYLASVTETTWQLSPAPDAEEIVARWAARRPRPGDKSVRELHL